MNYFSMFKNGRQPRMRSLLSSFVVFAILLQSGGVTVASVAYAEVLEGSPVTTENVSVSETIEVSHADEYTFVSNQDGSEDVAETPSQEEEDSASYGQDDNGQLSDTEDNEAGALRTLLLDLNTQTNLAVETNVEVSEDEDAELSASSQSSSDVYASVNASMTTVSGGSSSYVDVGIKQILPIKAADCHASCENVGQGDAGGISLGGGEMIWHFVLTGSDTSKPAKLHATFSGGVTISDLSPGKVVNGVQHFYVKTGNTSTLTSAKAKNAVAKYGKHMVFTLSDCVFGKDEPQPQPKLSTISATKIVCDEESDLPNWGLGGADITKDTATQFLATHPRCHLMEGWKFEYAPGDTENPGDNTTALSGSPWKYSPATNSQGETSWTVTATSGKIWVREVFQSGYIPFSYNTSGKKNTDNVSAEMYCHTDVLNYDNYDYVAPVDAGKTFYCIAFNALKTSATNQKPVITVLGTNPLTLTVGTLFTDPGATAFDIEDGTITPSIIATGTVNTSVVGTYTITYNVSDSKGLAAIEKTRTVHVVPVATNPACSDGVDNDLDGKIDFPADLGCENGNDNDENSRPVITVTLPNPTVVQIGTLFTDPGATAFDLEDGTITPSIIATGTVTVIEVGNYTITYNVSDSKGLAATPKTRTVKVISACSDGVDNDADGKIDTGDSGCVNPNDNDENTPPTITVIGANPLSVLVGTLFTDPGATAFDLEDGTITPTVAGSVNTSVLGTYTLTYTAQDSNGATATPKTRTVHVVPVVTNPACSDGVDNDADGKIDFPADLGCENGNDNDENSRPVITVLGTNPLTLTVGTLFTDPGATAFDLEDGTLTPPLFSATGTVNVNLVGNYVIVYNATDTKGLAAVEKTRTVKVVSVCSDGVDNDADGKIDFPADEGCEGPNDNTENARPVITVLGTNPLTLTVGTLFTDPGATAFDIEDGTITPSIIATGTVNTSVVGTYTITYNVSDSKGLAAIEKTRTVNITSGGGGCTSNCGGSTPPACSNGSDDDGDGLPDYPRDPGCTSSTDNDERDGGPVITLVGGNPLSITVGASFTDPGATATDPEDGDITSRITVGGTVGTSSVGTYTLTYNVTDTAGHAATPVTRTVNVVAAGCTTNCGGGGGGGGGGTVPLAISNEKISTTTAQGEAVISWNTNLAATSRVVYGITSVSVVGTAPLYGYVTSNATDTSNVYTHSMKISGLIEGVNYYFRPVSTEGNQKVVGIELALNPKTPETCFYLREYLRLGQNNNRDEVVKLQRFLRDFEGFTTLSVSGFFDITTDAAVRSFQDRYATDVLTPWNLPGNTGYVYYTTQKKVNEIYCKRAFPLNELQNQEIEAFKRLLENLNTVSGGTITLPIVGTTGGGTTGGAGLAAGEGATGGGQVAGAATEEGELTDVATDDEPTMIDRGRIALSDLLATVPNVAEKLTSGNNKDVNATDTDAMSGVYATGSKQIAALGFLKKFDTCTWALWALFLIVLVLLVMYVRLWAKHRDDDDTPVFPSVS